MDVLGEQLLAEVGPQQQRVQTVWDLESGPWSYDTKVGKKEKIDSLEPRTGEAGFGESCSGTGEGVRGSGVRGGSGAGEVTMGCGSWDTKG